MLKKIFIYLTILLISVAILVNSKPSHFSVLRSITISAPANEIFELVNNQTNWSRWSPWAKLDPEMNKFYGGELRGVGSIYKWSGNKEVGVGTSTIIESKPNEFIKFKLDFKKPMTASYISEFKFSQSGRQTIISWKMHGNKNFLTKLVSLFIDCEKVAGEQFEEGLKNLKKVSERYSPY